MEREKVIAMDREEIKRWLNVCKTAYFAVGVSEDYPCYFCPYKDKEHCQKALMADVLALLIEQEEIIKQYHKADTFLDTHGWKWE